MNSIYTISYDGELYKAGNKKYIYYTVEQARDAIGSLSSRIARSKISTWKDYTVDEKNKLIGDELEKFTIVEYVKAIN